MGFAAVLACSARTFADGPSYYLEGTATTFATRDAGYVEKLLNDLRRASSTPANAETDFAEIVTRSAAFASTQGSFTIYRTPLGHRCDTVMAGRQPRSYFVGQAGDADVIAEYGSSESTSGEFVLIYNAFDPSRGMPTSYCPDFDLFSILAINPLPEEAGEPVADESGETGTLYRHERANGAGREWRVHSFTGESVVTAMASRLLGPDGMQQAAAYTFYGSFTQTPLGLMPMTVVHVVDNNPHFFVTIYRFDDVQGADSPNLDHLLRIRSTPSVGESLKVEDKRGKTIVVHRLPPAEVSSLSQVMDYVNSGDFASGSKARTLSSRSSQNSTIGSTSWLLGGGMVIVVVAGNIVIARRARSG